MTGFELVRPAAWDYGFLVSVFLCVFLGQNGSYFGVIL